MISHMVSASYLLVGWDYIQHGLEMDIPVRPGRGSSAVLLVAFALRITDIDQIEFNLALERSSNPELKRTPDIDTQPSAECRGRLITYVTGHSSRDLVVQIITLNCLKSKYVIKDTAKLHEAPYNEADRPAKMIPVVRGKPATLSQFLGDNTPSPHFKLTVHRNMAYSTCLDNARRTEGTNNSPTKADAFDSRPRPHIENPKTSGRESATQVLDGNLDTNYREGRPCAPSVSTGLTPNARQRHDQTDGHAERTTESPDTCQPPHNHLRFMRFMNMTILLLRTSRHLAYNSPVLTSMAIRCLLK